MLPERVGRGLTEWSGCTGPKNQNSERKKKDPLFSNAAVCEKLNEGARTCCC